MRANHVTAMSAALSPVPSPSSSTLKAARVAATAQVFAALSHGSQLRGAQCALARPRRPEARMVEPPDGGEA